MSVILLHPTEARCATAGLGGPMRSRCARSLAPPAGKVQDYANSPRGNTAQCEGFYDMGHARADAGKLFAEAAKQRIGRPA